MNKETIKLDITGMTCDHCATGIEKLLSKNEGVTEAKVNYPKASCECSYDPSKTSKEEINETLRKAAAEPYYQGILAVTDEELVSSDFIGNSYSSIVDLSLTDVVDGDLVKVVSWYDNEWGYSNRLVELTADVAKTLGQ